MNKAAGENKTTKGPSKTFGTNPAKKLKQSKPVSSDEGEADEKAFTDNESSQSEVEVKFELFNMAESDYHSIKQYLGNLFGAGEHNVDLVGLTSFIVEALADHLGTCIKTDGEPSDPFGFITGFPISYAPECLKTLEAFLVSKCPEVREFFGDKENVIIFQERLINVPGSIAAPLYRQFLDDWNSAAQEEFSFATPSNVLIIAPTYREIVSKLDAELGLQENPSKFGVASSETNFYYEEAEYFKDFVTRSFDFSVNTGHETSDSRRAFSENGIEPGRRLFILTWKNFEKFVAHLQDL